MSVEQHGVFSLEQLGQLGLTSTAIHKRAALGRLHRIHRGVYSLVPRELLKREGLYMAAVLACGPGAVLSHRSAATLHELRASGWTKIEVTVPRRSTLRHPGVAVHRSTKLTPADVTRVKNIPVTAVARTLLDLAEVVTHRQLERAFDQSEIAEVFDLKTIQDQLDRNPTRPGAKAVRKVLAEHYIGKTPTWNENEERLLALTRALGIPDPDTNAFVVLPDGGRAIRVDFVWRELRVALEVDGRETHDTQQAFETDRERDQRLTVAGWRPVRTTWRQLKYRPHELRPVLIKLLLPARGSPAESPAPGSRDEPGKPGVAGAPARALPQTKRAGESTSSARPAGRSP
jgi:hypothetical protein